jgi:hypothetical protein
MIGAAQAIKISHRRCGSHFMARAFISRFL